MKISRSAIYLCLLVTAAGCYTTDESTETPEPTTPTVQAEPLEGDSTLTAIGELQIDDRMDVARQLFPAPPGADIVSQPQLTLPGEEHFGWSSDNQIFDAFARNGKLTTVSLLKTGLTDSERQTQIDRELERFDEPDENAEGETNAAYLWRDGDFVRIVVDFFSGDDRGVLKVVGIAGSLEARGFPIEDVAHLVEAFDQRSLQ